MRHRVEKYFPREDRCEAIWPGNVTWPKAVITSNCVSLDGWVIWGWDFFFLCKFKPENEQRNEVVVKIGMGWASSKVPLSDNYVTPVVIRGLCNLSCIYKNNSLP